MVPPCRNRNTSSALAWPGVFANYWYTGKARRQRWLLSSTWEDADSFIDRYPGFQLEDELHVEGGGEMSCGAGITSVDPTFRCNNHRRRVDRRELGEQACRSACKAS
jgi:hypothetical protein